MRDKDLQRFRYYEALMKKIPKEGEARRKPESCAKCMYHQPEFKYRSCLFTRCPFKREEEIFRRRPLKTDPIPGPEVVRMDV